MVDYKRQSVIKDRRLYKSVAHLTVKGWWYK